jgi:hypothetical protein
MGYITSRMQYVLSTCSINLTEKLPPAFALFPAQEQFIAAIACIEHISP